MDRYSIFWFRRDLRLFDNAGLYHALKYGIDVKPIFIFDTNILDKLPPSDARVTFIYEHLKRLHSKLQILGSGLHVYYGDPLTIWASLGADTNLQSVYYNRDYETYAKSRDTAVNNLMDTYSIPTHAFKDHVIFDNDEVVKKDGKPYTVFTPYKKKWLEKLQEGSESPLHKSFYLSCYPSEHYLDNLWQGDGKFDISLESMGFQASDVAFPSRDLNAEIVMNYDERRDYPAVEGTSKLGVHLRFGTVSVREVAQEAYELNPVFLSELIWRDFYSNVLNHFPHVEQESFKAKYDAIPWRNDKDEYERWCQGRTGYPIVDAGMRELNETGYMHNRVRMIVASFLTKHLLIDWRWGERYFAEKLLDYDLASNNGGWQWAAGCGTDAAPYFRVFNPYTQTTKFDKQNEYIARWVPEWESPEYPAPIVDHKEARERCLATYKAFLAQ